MILFDETDVFRKEFKKLHKRYRTLSGDFAHLKIALRITAIPCDKHTAVLARQGNIQIVKIRMKCRALRDKSLRVIYAYNKDEDCITFLELYYKGDKDREDLNRIREFLLP